jgi:hypothetical protein
MSERNPRVGLDLRGIAEASRRNNKRVGVTGFLMFDGTYFTQALEGARSQVTKAYNRIAADPRHMNLHLVSCMDVPYRVFAGWPMGVLGDIPSGARDRILANFSLRRIDPDNVALDRVLYILQSLAAETVMPPLRHAAE